MAVEHWHQLGKKESDTIFVCFRAVFFVLPKKGPAQNKKYHRDLEQDLQVEKLEEVFPLPLRLKWNFLMLLTG